MRIRADFGLNVQDRIDPREFLQSLGIVVWTPSEIPGIQPEHLYQLTVEDPNSWSGVTVREGNSIAIIVNSTHSAARQANTLMHEWAHIELRHKPNRVDRSANGLLLLSDYPGELEEEADWLAGAVLVPREGLVEFRSSGMAAAQIAARFGVSEELATWRIRMTGVDKQIRGRSY